MYNKQVCISKGVPVASAFTCLDMYLRDLTKYPWKRDNPGVQSGTAYTYQDGMVLFVYLTKTSYVVRFG